MTFKQTVKRLGLYLVSSFNGRKGAIKLLEADMNGAVAPYSVVKGQGIKRITMGPDAPDNPQDGDLWIDTSSSSLT